MILKLGDAEVDVPVGEIEPPPVPPESQPEGQDSKSDGDAWPWWIR